MSIIALFNDLVAGGYVREWVELPYDWRYSARDVSQKLLGQVVSRARGYERIVFVAHSNGGLVLRHLLDLVSEQNPLLLSFISHSYFVAVPHRGTPQAATSLLFGHNLAVLGGVLVKSSTAQLLAQTIPGAYGLLPTSSLLAQLNDTFRDTHTDFSFLSDAVLIDPLAYLGQFHASTTGIAPAEPDILGRIRGEQDQINRAVTIPVTNIVGEGLRTVYGVRYTPVDSCTNISPFVIAVVASCVPHTKLIIEPLTTRAGDGTVISKSAQLTPSMVGGVNIPEAVNAYIDLAAYNKQSFVVSRDHSSITEASPVLDEIRGYFSGVLKSDFKLATTSRYALGGGVTGTSQALMVSVHSPILIDAYDSLGRHTGRLPDSTAYELNDQFLYETTIPNSSYWEIGDSKYILLDTDDSLADSISTSTEISIIMRGVGTGLATVVLSYIDGDDIVWSKVYKDVVTVPELKIETQLDLGGVGQSTHLDSEQSTTTVSLPGGYVTMTPLSSIASTTANMVTHFATSVYCRQRESGELMVQDVKADNR